MKHALFAPKSGAMSIKEARARALAVIAAGGLHGIGAPAIGRAP